MKSKILMIPTFLIILLSISACSKDKMSKLGVSEKFDITSVNTGTTYTMTAFYPGDAFPSSKVPVVYVLDGGSWGNMAAEALNDLSVNNEIPKCLLISLDYKKASGGSPRFTELVYPGEGIEGEAEGDKFYLFLRDELIPEVERNYACDTSERVLFGHSLAGFFTLYSLLDNASNLTFKKCIAASCSIGLGSDNLVFQKEREVSSLISNLPVSLFIGSGTYVESSPAMHEEFYRRLKSRNYPNLKIGFNTYPESHGTDAYPCFVEGIQFVFNH